MELFKSKKFLMTIIGLVLSIFISVLGNKMGLDNDMIVKILIMIGSFFGITITAHTATDIVAIIKKGIDE
jgi:uncharacterized membrane protein